MPPAGEQLHVEAAADVSREIEAAADVSREIEAAAEPKEAVAEVPMEAVAEVPMEAEAASGEESSESEAALGVYLEKWSPAARACFEDAATRINQLRRSGRWTQEAHNAIFAECYRAALKLDRPDDYAMRRWIVKEGHRRDPVVSDTSLYSDEEEESDAAVDEPVESVAAVGAPVEKADWGCYVGWSAAGRAHLEDGTDRVLQLRESGRWTRQEEDKIWGECYWAATKLDKPEEYAMAKKLQKQGTIFVGLSDASESDEPVENEAAVGAPVVTAQSLEEPMGVAVGVPQIEESPSGYDADCE
jgi:hypothetical protein